MEKENILGTEKIGKLMRKFSIPCIISLVVNSLYNIVDQIFIGWGVGYLGNGATNVVFPLTMICLAFALMFGDGSSEEFIEKNEQKRDSFDALNSGYYSEYNNSNELFAKESEIIKDIAKKESCVIIGRCADSILGNKDNVIKVFIYSSMKDKIKRATKYY